MTWITLGKYAALALILGGIVALIHHNGRVVEREECRARENTELATKIGELEEARLSAAEASAQAATLAAENLLLNNEVTNNAAQKLEQAAVNDARNRRDPGGLLIPAEICRARALPMPAPALGSENDHGPEQSTRVRLPSGIEASLYDLTFNANKARIKWEECREFALGLEQQRAAWENAQTQEGIENGR